MRVCKIEGCSKPHVAKGLCSMHYQRLPRVRKVRQAYYAKPKHKKALQAYRESPKGKAWRRTWDRSLKALFYRGKIAAKQQGRAWQITFEAFTLLRQQPCRYCGFLLPEAGYGLDRIDNSKGYLHDNVVPCCTSCNSARGDHFTHEEMLQEIGPVLRKVKLARVSPLPYTSDTSLKEPNNADPC